MSGATFAELWGELDAVREGRRLSRQSLAGRAAQVTGRPVPAKTLHDRMANGRRVSWDQMRAVVMALGLDEQEWRTRWQSADSGRRQGGRQHEKPVRSVAHLPPDSRTFTGRDSEVAHLLQSLTSDWTGTSVPCVVIAGMPGVGKTRLAIHAAHLLSDRYDEIQLYLDLRGYGPGPPVTPASALDTLLRHLGVAPETIPADLEARAALFRDRLHGRRAVVLLDNAVSEAQVRPLLPASPSCCVLVTSRRDLRDIDEARMLHLDVMRPSGALALLARLVGTDRLAAEADAAHQIAIQCGGLPLALTLVGCRLRARPTWRLTAMGERLRQGDRRLVEIGGGDRAVRVAFDLSYAHLAEADRTIFGLLSCHPAQNFSAGSAAALTGVDLTTVECVLEDLLDENLLEADGERRYRFHDLVRLFAHERLQVDQPEAAVRQARRRVLTWYLHRALQADQLLAPDSRLRPGSGSTSLFGSRDQALSWCDAERDALDSAVRMAAEVGDFAAAWQLAHALFGHHRLRHSWLQWLSQLRVGLGAARTLGDEQAEARMLNSMGAAKGALGHYEEAHRDLDAALLIQQRCGDRAGHGSTLNNLGELYRLTGRYDDAVTCYQQDWAICRDLADLYGQSICLNNLGKAQLALGRAADALASQSDALRLCDRHHDLHTRAEIIDDLGHVYRRLGRLSEALHHYALAVETYRRLGSDVAAATTLVTMVEVLVATDQRAQARVRATEARSILDGPATASAGAMSEGLRHQLAGLAPP